MKNMHIKYFMVLTVFILGLGDVPLHAAKKSGASSTTQNSSQQSAQLKSVLIHQKQELTQIQSAIRDAEKELKKLQKELPNPKNPKTKYDASKVNINDLNASLASLQKLHPMLKQLQAELPGAQKAGQLLLIQSKDLAKSIDATNDVIIKIKLYKNSLLTKDKKVAVIIQASTLIEDALILALAIVLVLLANTTTGTPLQSAINNIQTDF